MIGPSEGTSWRPPHGYSHRVHWDGEAVVKTFSNAGAWARERAALERLQDMASIPKIVPPIEPQVLRTQYVDGVLGERYVAHIGEAREARHQRFLMSCGAFLAQLHERTSNGDGVLVHGDFAPYNIIVSEAGHLHLVVDWEQAHVGQAVEDLAWMEWNMRIWYSVSRAALTTFYRSFGWTPAWTDRHAANA